MNTRRTIILFWILILIPAAVLAGAAYRLLSHEAQRLDAATLTSLTTRAGVLSENLDQALATVQENLTQTLLDFAGNDPRPEAVIGQLTSWERTNPLVRNVFVFTPPRELVYPSRSLAATAEERAFIQRFQGFFSGRLAFDTSPSSREMQRATPVARAPSSRKALFDLSRAQLPEIDAHMGLASRERSGWIPWFNQNQLYILGWVQQRPDSPILGMELEWTVLLSRLVVDFPGDLDGRGCLVLINGSREVIHTIGHKTEEQAPDREIPISPRLPHWQFQIYTPSHEQGLGPAFFKVSMGLTAVLIIAIIGAGFLITRTTLDRARDARQKTSFVSSVSHELKTPLTSIRMYAELLLSGRIKAPEKQRQYLDIMVGESLKLTRLINTVLDFGRLEQGRKTYSHTAFDLGDFIRELLITHRVRMEDAGMAVEFEFPDSPLPLVFDADALEQVVLNLMDNALKYAGEGQWLHFQCQAESHGISLRVTDRGPGIPRALHEKIFEKFYRADTSLTAAKPGSGLGLAIARQMMRDLGGDLSLDPAISQGACFVIRIPLHEQDTNSHS